MRELYVVGSTRAWGRGRECPGTFIHLAHVLVFSCKDTDGYTLDGEAGDFLSINPFWSLSLCGRACSHRRFRWIFRFSWTSKKLSHCAPGKHSVTSRRNDKKWSIGMERRVVADTTAVHTDAKCLTWHRAHRERAARHTTKRALAVYHKSVAQHMRLECILGGWMYLDGESQTIRTNKNLLAARQGSWALSSCSMTESERSCRVALHSYISKPVISRNIAHSLYSCEPCSKFTMACENHPSR